MIKINPIKLQFFFSLFCLPCFESSANIDPNNWIEWYKVKTQLPYSSSLTLYPPVNLYVDGDTVKGTLASPYSFDSADNNPANKFLVAVTDTKGTTHFLIPEMTSVGFENETGISIANLYSENFENGQVIVQLYRVNSVENRTKLQQLHNNNEERNKGITTALAKMHLDAPIVGEIWRFSATTSNDKTLNDVIETSTTTIVQLYSPFCGFCKQSIPLVNRLNNDKGIKVVGLSGTDNIAEFKQHLITHEVEYPFIIFEGEYSESALLRATGQNGFPTYIVLNGTKQVQTILVGSPALEEWLSTHR